MAGCKGPAPGRQPFREVFPSEATPPTAEPARHVAAPELAKGARARCLARMADLRRAPALDGAPALEAHRAEVLARAKSVPVLFRRTPRIARDAGAEVEMYRAELARSAAPGWELAKLYKYLVNRPELSRALLLREGYLYADSPAMAAALAEYVELPLVFREPSLVIQRGSRLLHAHRKGLGYEYVDGPEHGERAHLLLFDRVWVEGHEPGPALHLDVRELAHTLHFDRMRVERMTAGALLADLRYGDVWVKSVIAVRDTHLSLECEVVPDGAEERLATAQRLARRAARVVAAERDAINELVNEALPFDEPRTEHGQQDGNLRPAWIWAYDHGWDYYTFNDDTYRVFDLRGRPMPPQVCIDFVTDTLERASGTWWRPSDKQRQRVEGGLDFNTIGIENRRSVDAFLHFAHAHPEWFDVYELAPEERVPFIQRDRFFSHLAEHEDRYRPGDIIAIHGLRNDGQVHWHSFYVAESDPVSGMPTLLAGNAGHPRVRPWEMVMRAAPLRSIRARIRPRLDWIAPLLSGSGGAVASGAAHDAASPI